ncbi:FlgD immunoglobulin-like domain containing protein [Streptomyces sp. NPDC012637]|uniref:FlgD immunoglobulin-like domain containing protein n=1 Tax=Streptomyces sp. NPDC012637 TaxID=3364842 RepID=UPI0036EE8495
MSSSTRRRGRARGFVHAALVLSLAVPTGLGAAGAAFAADPATDPATAPVVVPAGARFVPRATLVLNAGQTGFLTAQEGDDRLRWIDYATGATTVLDQRLPQKPVYDVDNGRFTSEPAVGGHGYGMDYFALYAESPKPHVSLLPVKSGPADGTAEVTVIDIPEGQSYVGTYGTTVVTRTGTVAATTSLHLLTAGADGTTQDRPLTGLPEGWRVYVNDSDKKSIVISASRWVDSTAETASWLVNLAEGVLEPLPQRQTWDTFKLGPDHILRKGYYEATVLDRNDPAAAGRDLDLRDMPYGDDYVALGTKPDATVLLSLGGIQPGNNEYRGAPLFTYRPGVGNEAVLELARGQLVTLPDGSVIVAGAETVPSYGAPDWAYYRFALAADGSVTRTKVADIEDMEARPFGIALGSGILTTADDSHAYAPHTYVGAYRSTWLNTSGRPEPGRTTTDGLISGDDEECDAEQGYCLTMFASGDGLHGRKNSRWPGGTVLLENGSQEWGPRIDGVVSTPRMADLSGRYGLVQEAVQGGPQAVVDFGTGAGKGTAPKVVLKRDPMPAALWGDTLWGAGKSGSTVSATSLAAGGTTVTESFAIPGACRPSELQAVGRFVYWHCDEGYSGSFRGAGVYDRQAKKFTTAPAGSTLLGDGYLAVANEGQGIDVYDLQGGLPASGTHADLPKRNAVSGADLGTSTRARVNWTVDRFGGHLAYVGDDRRVRVVPTGVQTSPLTVIDQAVPGTALDLTTSGASVGGRWWLSKPAASWEFTLRHAATGDVVRTVRGTDARGRVDAAWDGKDEAGKSVANGAYTWTLTAVPADGAGPVLQRTGPVHVLGGAASGTYRPVTPSRVMDTRSGVGVPKAKLGPGGTVTLTVAGQGGVPASGVTAVVMNVTATNATAGTFVSVYPAGTTRTSASNLNVVAGQTVPNLVVVPVKDGKVTFYNKSGSLDLLADVAGYYTTDGEGSRFRPVTPSRVMDTRSGVGVAKAKVGAGGTVTLTVAGQGEVPASNVTAVVMNVTATNATAGTFVSVYPAGTTRTSASNLNVVAGQTVPNLVIVPVQDGKVTFYNRAGTVDLLADVAGYYTTEPTGSLYEPVTPSRVMDTRSGVGVPKAKVGPGGTVTLTVAGQGGVPASGVTAVVMNVTATNATAGTFVSVYPAGTTRTSASNLNVVAGQTVPNLVVVPVKDGKVTFYNKSGSLDLLADVAGYYTG